MGVGVKAAQHNIKFWRMLVYIRFFGEQLDKGALALVYNYETKRTIMRP